MDLVNGCANLCPNLCFYVLTLFFTRHKFSQACFFPLGSSPISLYYFFIVSNYLCVCVFLLCLIVFLFKLYYLKKIKCNEQSQYREANTCSFNLWTLQRGRILKRYGWSDDQSLLSCDNDALVDDLWESCVKHFRQIPVVLHVTTFIQNF